MGNKASIPRSGSGDQEASKERSSALSAKLSPFHKENERVSPNTPSADTSQSQVMLGTDGRTSLEARSSVNSLEHQSGSQAGSTNMRRGRDLEQIASYKALNERTLSDTKSRLERVQSHDDLKADFHAREVAAAALKAEMASDWLPEYRPVSIVPPEYTPDTVLERVTRISPATIFKDVPADRKVKVVCTMGPASWSEEGLGKLLDAGMNVARFNFSHGSHEAHQEVLDRLRKVANEKEKIIAYLLDTKGPEIRTAMLKGGKDMELEAGQEAIVVAVGDDYDKWEGYKDPSTGGNISPAGYVNMEHAIWQAVAKMMGAMQK